MPRIFVGVAIAALLARVLTMLMEPAPYWHTYTMTHCRIDSLMFGVVLSYYWNYQTKRLQSFVERHAVTLLLFAVACFAVVNLVFSRWWVSNIGFSLIWLGWGSVLLVFCCNPQKRLVPQGILNSFAFVGQYSYSIYLWHVAVLFWGEQFLAAMGIQLDFAIRATLYVVVSATFGVILARMVEFPVLKLRDRFFPSRSSATSLTQQQVVYDHRFLHI